jgi:hypothetical protein
MALFIMRKIEDGAEVSDNPKAFGVCQHCRLPLSAPFEVQGKPIDGYFVPDYHSH